MPLFSRAFAITCASTFAGAGLKAAYDSHSSTVHAMKPVYNLKEKSVFKPTFQKFPLGEVFNLSEDTAVFRFLMPNIDDTFHLSPCSTLQAQHSTGGNRVEQLQRSYTPITQNGEKGYFDILVKKQAKGRMTEVLFSLKPGDQLEFRATNHKLHYQANKWKYIGCIGGGTGITPLLQVIREVCHNPEDNTKVSLMFGNRSEGKILLRGVLDDLAAKYPTKFKANYTIDEFDDSNRHTWKGFTGHINRKMLDKTMPPAQPGTLILICGPDLMMHHLAGVQMMTLKEMSGGLGGAKPQQPLGGAINNFQEIGGTLAAMGYTSEQVYRF